MPPPAVGTPIRGRRRGPQEESEQPAAELVGPSALEAESNRLSKAIVDAQETLRSLNLPVSASVRLSDDTVLHWWRWREADRK